MVTTRGMDAKGESEEEETPRAVEAEENPRARRADRGGGMATKPTSTRPKRKTTQPKAAVEEE